jgi:hypothetical protein
MRTKIQVAPIFELSPYPPAASVLPSEDSDTEYPRNDGLTVPDPDNMLICCDHAVPLRISTETAPWLL